MLAFLGLALAPIRYFFSGHRLGVDKAFYWAGKRHTVQFCSRCGEIKVH